MNAHQRPNDARRAINVLAFTGGETIPSARFRVRQYVKPLEVFGIVVDERASKARQYPPARSVSRPLWFVKGVLERLPQVATSARYDLVLFQRELLSTFVTLEPFAGRPRLLDVDDAIWLGKRGTFARRLGRLSDAVVCGNNFIADYFESCGCRTFVLPTGVDTARFGPGLGASKAGPPVVGWSGSGGNLAELERLEPMLVKVFQKHRDARLRVICNRPPRLKSLSERQVEFLTWSPDVEVPGLQDLCAGLMPLSDDEWAKGKCAYKMLTYMSCAIPVVVSPIGMNAEVLGLGEVGFGARSDEEWIESLDLLLSDEGLRTRMGANGRAVVEREFSVNRLVVKLADILLAMTR